MMVVNVVTDAVIGRESLSGVGAGMREDREISSSRATSHRAPMPRGSRFQVPLTNRYPLRRAPIATNGTIASAFGSRSGPGGVHWLHRQWAFARLGAPRATVPRGAVCRCPLLARQRGRCLPPSCPEGDRAPGGANTSCASSDFDAFVRFNSSPAARNLPEKASSEGPGLRWAEQVASRQARSTVPFRSGFRRRSVVVGGFAKPVGAMVPIGH